MLLTGCHKQMLLNKRRILIIGLISGATNFARYATTLNGLFSINFYTIHSTLFCTGTTLRMVFPCFCLVNNRIGKTI